MSELLLDTHIWFWYLIGSSRLPSGLRDLIDRSVSACWLSPVSVWEIGLLAARGRIGLQTDLRRWVHQAREQFPIKDAPLNLEVALVSQEISLPHRDPADHFLAATTVVYNLTLLTVDQHLTEADWLPTRSI
ncbi:MAG: twitching motility protein PilT [Candidatus Entotheonella factor]|uniref:Twitching motility protein PilT n=1 Tax=Entotheonella factor TaxID=1429438 RepID=W4LA56_ENTF1|nr:type II toxin-antitoxin system VapC family toxin [Candidatus Entotheonella palauensis]ETW94983.1 MAG: twitching motility protein PilT [Candidatus Entotheonella factor]